MKKVNIFITCFSLLYLVAVIYFDGILKIVSFYWLVVELTGKVVICISLILKLYHHGDRTKLSLGFNVIVWFSMCGFYGYQDIARYNRNVCQDKFGRVFNKTRRKIGTPQIPADWDIDYRLDRTVLWKARDTTIGHQSKGISIDADCRIKKEYDEYKLKPKDSGLSSMSITTTYARGNGKDSIFYYYNPGDSSRLISRQQADSVFAAQKISKD